MPALPIFDFAPYRLSGTVYDALLNDPLDLASLGEAAYQSPYKMPPKAPVLCVKPRNTLAGTGDTLRIPVDQEALAIGATLGMVIGRTACRVPVARALDYIAGYTIVNNVSIPHLRSHCVSIAHACPWTMRSAPSGWTGKTAWKQAFLPRYTKDAGPDRPARKSPRLQP